MVDRGTVVVSVLTSTGNRPLDVVRVPGTDTSDLAETLVSFAGELLGAPTLGDTGETVTLGDGNDINHLVLLEDGVDGHGLLEKLLAEINLVGDGAAVDLNLHQVGLLLLEGRLADLGVGEDADDGAVLLHALELAGDGGARGFGVLLGVLGKGLLLALVPVLVEAALELVGQMLGPDGVERAQAPGGLDVSDKTNNDHLNSQKMLAICAKQSGLHCSYRWGINDGHSLDHFLLVGLGAGAVDVADDRGHAGLVAHGGGEVDGLLGVILGEAKQRRAN